MGQTSAPLNLERVLTERPPPPGRPATTIRDIHDSFFSHGQLRARGMTRRRIEAAVRQGRAVKVGWGWYAVPGSDPTVAAALARGRRITCYSALALYGLWVLDRSGTHEYGRKGIGGRATTGHRAACRWPNDSPVAPLHYALDDALRCGSASESAVVLESAINKRLLSFEEAESLLAAVPRDRRRQIGRISGLSESGTETLMHRILDAMRVPYRQQVRLAHGHRVDFRVGKRLIIECDSLAFHGNTIDAYRVDRARDLASMELGFHTLRFTWQQIVFEPDRVEAAIRSALSHDRRSRVR